MAFALRRQLATHSRRLPLLRGGIGSSRVLSSGGSPASSQLLAILERVSSGQLQPEEAVAQVQGASAYVEIDEFAKVDHLRGRRTGLPEVVFGQGKTTEHIVQIMKVLAEEVDVALVTRVEPDVFHALEAAGLGGHLTHFEMARMVALCHRPGPPRPATIIPGRVVVATAGTADLPVAEEAAATAELMGIEEVVRLWDIGVAGIQRLLRNRETLQDCDVIIVAAGMEGALPSVVAGMVDAPVIAVPTSVGYGASMQGVTPMLTMLSSCAPGIGVVNIDNGFGVPCHFVVSALSQLAFPS